MDTLQQLVLSTLNATEIIEDTRRLNIPEEFGSPNDQETQLALQGALNSLQSKDMISYNINEQIVHVLTPEGSQIAREGSHEARVWSAAPFKGEHSPLKLSDLKIKVGEDTSKIGQGRAFKNGWIGKEGDGIVKLMRSIDDKTQVELQEIESYGTLKAGDKALAEVRKRKLAIQRKYLWFTVKKGANFRSEIEKLETDLTVEMLSSGSWKTSKYKKYNFDAEGTPTNGGALHPLLKVREEFRNIFFEMGFAEMPTSNYVESGFWNFDALFVPQQHPARDLQDTFYLSEDPSTSLDPPSELYSKVATIHSIGGNGSTGYRAPFLKTESTKLLLRTHTTARSANMLYDIANQPGGFKPTKMFSIDRVFRNETMDATHLAEFHQVEGVVADRGLTLGDLIGFMQTFFGKMGITNLRFKPAYNPYTEPSLEIFAFHPALKKWVEIGNSGMFRPEMLEPLGLPSDVRVHGWGLSLERPTMIRYGINNIRTLVGHKVSIESVEKSSAVRF
ncbi:hypothetical protein Clacol_001635 [Clathrus columnatus]|uniref:Probable phenylalanine--tRNA ligase alpha subunit n=1 Tax=Clathrus columnatus TaxID=1419009 RepID=A0AAV5A2J0_9AGAM|nr:hypothetical protein Clacol_001635 [Clathrus columnatus]